MQRNGPDADEAGHADGPGGLTGPAGAEAQAAARAWLDLWERNVSWLAAEGPAPDRAGCGSGSGAA